MSKHEFPQVFGALQNVRERQWGWEANCPSHETGSKRHSRSLTVRLSPKGDVLVKCHRGCSFAQIREAMGLDVGDFNRPKDDRRTNRGQHRRSADVTQLGPIEKEYDYRDENGELLFQVVRHQGKEFRQRHKDQRGNWVWGLNGTRRVLYRLPELNAAAGRKVFVVEGEKDADNLVKLGFVATTNPMGALKWTSADKQYSAPLKGRDVVLIDDFDPLDEKLGFRTGERHMDQVAEALKGFADRIVRIRRLPGMAEKTDVSDWLADGGTKDQLIALVKDAEVVFDRKADKRGAAPAKGADSKLVTGSGATPPLGVSDDGQQMRLRRMLTALRITENASSMPNGDWLRSTRTLLEDFERGLQ